MTEGNQPAREMPGLIQDSLFYSLFQTTPDPCLLLTDSQILACNPAAVRVLGFSGCDTLTCSPISILSPDSNQADSETESLMAHLSRAWEAGSIRAECRIRKADLQDISVEISCTVVSAARPPFMHVILREIPGSAYMVHLLKLERNLGLALGSTNDMDDALQLILDTALNLPDVDSGGIYLVDPRTGSISLKAHRGLSPLFIDQVSRYAPDSPHAEQIRSGRPVYEIAATVGEAMDQIIKREGLCATASVPVFSAGRAVGAFNIGSRSMPEFSPETRMTMEILASQLGGILARIQDATVLAESQQNLRIFFDTIGDLVFIVQESGQIIDVNHTALTRLGYSSGDLIGEHFSVIHPATTGDDGERIFAEMVSGTMKVCPLPLMSSSGEIIPAETRITRGTWSGQPAIFGISRDISIQEQMGRELRDTLDLNEKIIASSLLGIIAYRADSGRCVMTNQAATTILGIPAENILFRRFSDLPCWEHTPILSRADEVLKTGEKQRLEIRSISPQGRPLWIGCILIPFTSTNHLHLLCIFDDISKRKSYEDEARKRELILRSIARSARSLLSESVLEDAIRSSLQDLGQAVGVDRVYIFENHRDSKTGTLMTSQRYEWACEGVEQMILSEALQATPYSLIPRWEQELSSGMIISGLVEEFESPVREMLEDQGIISILVVPILTGNEFWGFIGFDDCHTRRIWTATDNIVLKVAADIIGGAICRRMMLDALVETKQQLADIIEHLPDATMVISSDGIVTAWNRAMEELTGVMGDDIIGQGEHRYAIPFYGDRRPILADHALLPENTLSGHSGSPFTIDKTLSGETIITRNGKPRHLSARASVLRDHHGKAIGAIESIRDITWQIEAEQKIRQYALDLEDKNRDLDLLSRSLLELNQELDQRVVDRTAEVLRLLEIKNDLITQIGHDLKTPLTPIIALLPEVLDLTTDPVMREYLLIVHRNAERLRQVVMMVLAYSRLEAASTVMNPSGVLLKEVFDQAFLDSSFDIKQKGLLVHNSIPQTLRLLVAETHVQTLAMNLISNAVKYSLPGGCIAVKARYDGKGVQICIRDSGIGMTPEEISRIFEEFYQADTSRHDRNSCGLGLAIVSRIVTMYGGTITAHSDGKGKGSEFCISLDSTRVIDSTQTS